MYYERFSETDLRPIPGEPVMRLFFRIFGLFYEYT